MFLHKQTFVDMFLLRVTARSVFENKNKQNYTHTTEQKSSPEATERILSSRVRVCSLDGCLSVGCFASRVLLLREPILISLSVENAIRPDVRILRVGTVRGRLMKEELVLFRSTTRCASIFDYCAIGYSTAID